MILHSKIVFNEQFSSCRGVIHSIVIVRVKDNEQDDKFSTSGGICSRHQESQQLLGRGFYHNSRRQDLSNGETSAG